MTFALIAALFTAPASTPAALREGRGSLRLAVPVGGD